MNVLDRKRTVTCGFPPCLHQRRRGVRRAERQKERSASCTMETTAKQRAAVWRTSLKLKYTFIGLVVASEALTLHVIFFAKQEPMFAWVISGHLRQPCTLCPTKRTFGGLRAPLLNQLNERLAQFMGAFEHAHLYRSAGGPHHRGHAASATLSEPGRPH